MDKLLLNGVGTLGSVGSTYIVGLISFIIIGVSLLIILYRIVKWMSRLDDMMTSLVAQTYIQQQKEKEEQKGWIYLLLQEAKWRTWRISRLMNRTHCVVVKLSLQRCLERNSALCSSCFQGNSNIELTFER